MADSPVALGAFARREWGRGQVMAVLAVLALVLALAGMGVAGYLAFENVQGNTTACGVTHGCSTVQESRYGKLMGVPVSVPGLLLYVVLAGGAVAWLADFRRLRPLVTLAAFAGVLFGLLFSAYLTYIEAFVLHAWCIFCVISALIMAALAATWATILVLYAREPRPPADG